MSLLINYTTSQSQKVLGTSISHLKDETALISPVIEIEITHAVPSVTPTNTPRKAESSPPLPSVTVRIKQPTPTPIPSPTKIFNESQYTAEKINDVTWKVHNLQNDDRMASAGDIINAINSYRGSKGLSNLSSDSKLMSYAQERADLFSKNGSLDSHAGFNSFMDNGGFEKAGFNSLGENSAYLSGPMNGDKIVRSLFGADESHDSNQLDNWTHIGVGVNGNAVNVNFGKDRK